MRNIAIAVAAILLAGVAGASAQQKPAVDARQDRRRHRQAASRRRRPTGRRASTGRDDAAVLGRTRTPRRRRWPRRSRSASRPASSIPPTASSWATGRRARRWRSPATACASPTIRRGRPNGGNCYACHQLTKKEVSYGTLGPSLLGYGKLRNFSEADTKAAYEKIYNSQAAFPCSTMPRFGANKVLTIEQIKDAVALLMSPDSPVNK